MIKAWPHFGESSAALFISNTYLFDRGKGCFLRSSIALLFHCLDNYLKKAGLNLMVQKMLLPMATNDNKRSLEKTLTAVVELLDTERHPPQATLSTLEQDIAVPA